MLLTNILKPWRHIINTTKMKSGDIKFRKVLTIKELYDAHQ